MVETNWRAVALGFGIIFFINMVSVLVEPLALFGGLVAAIAGGWTAGYYARTGASNGAWNGFLAGSIGALLVAGILVVLGLAVSIVELSLGGVFATITVGLAMLVFVIVGAIPATIGGYLGGMYGPEETEDVSQPTV